MFFICLDHRRKIFGVEMVNVIVLHDAGQPASASRLGPGCWTSVNVSTLTAEAKHLVVLLHPYLKLQGEDGETQILLAVIFLDFETFWWKNTGIIGSNGSGLWNRCLNMTITSHLSGCLCRVIPLLQEQHGVVGGEGDLFPRIHPVMSLLLVSHSQQPQPDDLWVWTNLSES